MRDRISSAGSAGVEAKLICGLSARPVTLMPTAISEKMTDQTGVWTQRASVAAPLVARIALALVFLYFGFSQLRDPSSFVGWLPAEAALLPISGAKFVLLNGVFEVLFGSLLLLGIYTRLSAALLGLHLLGIAVSMGFTQTGVRDLGLAFATIAVALHGPSRYSLDAFFTRKR